MTTRENSGRGGGRGASSSHFDECKGGRGRWRRVYKEFKQLKWEGNEGKLVNPKVIANRMNECPLIVVGVATQGPANPDTVSTVPGLNQAGGHTWQYHPIICLSLEKLHVSSCFVRLHPQVLLTKFSSSAMAAVRMFPPILSPRVIPRLFRSLDSVSASVRRWPLFALNSAVLSSTILRPAPISISIPEILSDIWESVLRAVPKKKTSHMKKRHRQMAGKALKDNKNLNKCPGCGQIKRAHVLCPNCVEGMCISQWFVDPARTLTIHFP